MITYVIHPSLSFSLYICIVIVRKTFLSRYFDKCKFNLIDKSFFLDVVHPGRTVRPGNGRFRVIPVILWKQFSRPDIFRIFSNDFRPVPAWKVREVGRNPAEKCGQFFGRNTASMFQWFPVFSCRIRWLFRIFLAGSFGIRWPEASTWEQHHQRYHRHHLKIFTSYWTKSSSSRKKIIH